MENYQNSCPIICLLLILCYCNFRRRRKRPRLQRSGLSLLEEYKAANPLVHKIHYNNASVVNIPECQLNWKIKLNGFCSSKVSVSVHVFCFRPSGNMWEWIWWTKSTNDFGIEVQTSIWFCSFKTLIKKSLKTSILFWLN